MLVSLLALHAIASQSIIQMDSSWHAAPQRQQISVSKVRKYPSAGKQKTTLPWNGKFSAKRFYKTHEKRELDNIKQNLRRTILALPKSHTQYLKYLEVRNQKHESRGMANHEKMILNIGTISSDEELSAIFIHELAHVVDLGKFRGGPRAGISNFRDGKKPIYNNDKSLEFYRLSWQNTKKRKLEARKADFVSGYAMVDAFEDFAEHYVFYRLHGEKFRAMADESAVLAQKYNFMRYEVFAGQEFQKQRTNTTLSNTLAWDTTLLPYLQANLISRK